MLKDRLIARIRESGPIPFDDFMATCLYDPEDGFFTAGPLRSTKGGDFLTSPEVSPLFGETLGAFVDAEWIRLGEPEAFCVVDIGGGSGSLLAPLLDSVGMVPEPWAVEASPAAREALGGVIDADRVVQMLEDLPEPLVGVVVANELLDNLPAALVVRAGSGWEERRVGVTGDELVLEAAPARPEVAAWADAFGGAVPDGGMVEVQLVASRWVGDVVGKLQAGVLVAIDYGGTAEELEPRRTRGTLRTYRNHHLGPDPLTEPGATDITVDVNFSAMRSAAEKAGARVELFRQDDFLSAWGLRDVVRRLREEELEHARSADAMARLRARSDRTEAETLLHPRGLGDFRVLVARK